MGDGWNEEEQRLAKKGTIFIPFSQFPPKKLRKDCFYFTTPAMITPVSFKNMHSCEVITTHYHPSTFFFLLRYISMCRILNSKLLHEIIVVLVHSSTLIYLLYIYVSHIKFRLQLEFIFTIKKIIQYFFFSDMLFNL